jgi:ubiquinone/menaquinone biosynthesis C-methylase UbiE
VAAHSAEESLPAVEQLGTVRRLRQLEVVAGHIGLEVDPVHVAMARELVAEQGLTNVEVIQADARNTGLPPASFDVAHARTVLVNVPDPERYWRK